jgi:LmbE family N-acetylglucosaminyl deacetylase
VTAIEPLAAHRVLVVAPHPDDETLGCGGLIARLVAAGSIVHTVFVTDGGASHPHSRAWPRPRLTALREREATEALAALGAGESPRTFLRLSDAAMPPIGTTAFSEARDVLVGILGDLRPDLVVLPWRRDPHCDHRDGWRLAREAVRQCAQDPPILEYAIWLDELGGARRLSDRRRSRGSPRRRRPGGDGQAVRARRASLADLRPHRRRPDRLPPQARNHRKADDEH